jgi:phage-related holin
MTIDGLTHEDSSLCIGTDVDDFSRLWMTAAIGRSLRSRWSWFGSDCTIMALLILALEHVIDTRIRTRKNN